MTEPDPEAPRPDRYRQILINVIGGCIVVGVALWFFRGSAQSALETARYVAGVLGESTDVKVVSAESRLHLANLLLIIWGISSVLFVSAVAVVVAFKRADEEP